MERLREFIDNNREEFEVDKLPAGHRVRFFFRLHYRLILSAGTAAAVLLLLISTPLFYRDYFGLDADKCHKMLENKELEIVTIADKLDVREKEHVLRTLDQLVNDVIPFEEQIPESMNDKEKDKILSNYYKTKIEGVDKLLAYAEKIQ